MPGSFSANVSWAHRIGLSNHGREAGSASNGPAATVHFRKSRRFIAGRVYQKPYRADIYYSTILLQADLFLLTRFCSIRVRAMSWHSGVRIRT